MRARHLILVTPLLGAGLVLGAVEAPQTAVNTGTIKTVASNAVQCPEGMIDCGGVCFSCIYGPDGGCGC